MDDAIFSDEKAAACVCAVPPGFALLLSSLTASASAHAYVDGAGRSYPMKRNDRFGFYNEIAQAPCRRHSAA